MNRHRRIAMTCRVCGQSFMARRSDLIKGRGGLLCSRKCSAKRSHQSRSASAPHSESVPAMDASHPLPASPEPRTEAQEP